MKIEEVKKNFNATKEGIRIVKVAAFCFAIVSFIATAEGLREYVFTDSSWQAILISFGIQSILFVLNLKLPEYFDRIGEISSKGNRKHRKYHFGKQRGQEKKTYRWTFVQRIMPLFYLLFMLMSSLFSFVYICDYVVYQHLSGYSDDHTILSNLYGDVLSKVERYIQEDTKVVQLMASSQLSELQGELSAPLQTDITSLRNTLKEKEHAEDLARIAYENSVLVYQSAQAYVGSLEDERYVQRDTYNKAIQDRNLAQTDMNSKKTVYETAKQERQDAQNALTTAQGSFDVLGAEFLSKLLEIDPSATMPLS